MTYVVQVWEPRQRAWDGVRTCETVEAAMRAGQAASWARVDVRVLAVPTEQEILTSLDELVADGTLRRRVRVSDHKVAYVLRDGIAP